MKVKEALTYFKTFYKDFNLERAHHLLADLGIDENSRLKKLSKGNKEKVQLILVMSRDARLYVLMNPLVGWIQRLCLYPQYHYQQLLTNFYRFDFYPLDF